jgi:hypothetical protein
MRPAVPAALAKLAAHPRWSVRHAVKRALVQNPSTPLADAIRIATTLRPAELAELAGDAALPEPLRVHAADLEPLRRRATASRPLTRVERGGQARRDEADDPGAVVRPRVRPR